MLRLLLKLLKWLLIAVVVYLAVTAWQVWRTGQQYAPQAAGAIVVMGAAQYNGVPSPDLQARLEQAGAAVAPALLVDHRGHRLQGAG